MTVRAMWGWLVLLVAVGVAFLRIGTRRIHVYAD
jgi:hypothetical protein